MPILLTLFSTGFTAVFAFLTAKVGAKFALLLVLVGVYVTAAGAFLVVINTLIGGLVSTLPGFVADIFSMLPTNTDECIAICVSAEAAAYVYRQVVIIASIKTRL